MNLTQKFSSISVWKVNKMTNNYNKNKNKGLMMLNIKFKGHIVNVHINNGLIIMFTLHLINCFIKLSDFSWIFEQKLQCYCVLDNHVIFLHIIYTLDN